MDTLTIDELISRTAPMAVGEARPADCVYVTEALNADLRRRFLPSEAPRGRWDFNLPTTFFDVPVVVNDDMATVGGGSWALRFHHRPAVG